MSIGKKMLTGLFNPAAIASGFASFAFFQNGRNLIGVGFAALALVAYARPVIKDHFFPEQNVQGPNPDS
ncbi:MAG: hypothetical protein H6861_02345 [Rhodospirillales bacterium]|nr:hypothetical protein [Rhodospirillales bacterium]